jgi:hypothetical protein
MKTKNNVQKTILKSVAVLLSLVLVSFTVGATGSWKELLADNSFGEIAKVMIEHSSETGSYNTANFLFEESESPLELEEWMTGNEYFTTFSIQFENASEKALEIEGWMIDNSTFDFNTTQEDPLQIEPWMLDNNFWE